LHALAAWAPRNRPDAVETYFEVRQSALDELGGAASLSLAAHLHDLGARFSRVDGCYDDRVRRAESADVAEAFRRGDTLTHVRRMKVFNKYTTTPDGDVMLDGSAVYIGSATSAAMLRVYDKAAESGRPDAGIRWELQLSHEHATRFVAGAVASGDHLGAYVLASIRGLVDFRDRSGHERGDAERIGLNGPARVDSLERRGAWLARQAAPSLALLYFALGPDWLNDLLRSGQERLTVQPDRDPGATGGDRPSHGARGPSRDCRGAAGGGRNIRNWSGREK
jgi:DNA relaxase NicK